MTKSLNKIINSIAESLTSFNLTDDFNIDFEIIADKIHDVRNSLIYDDWKARMMDDAYYQKVCCLEVECETITCDLGGIALKSPRQQFYVDLPGLNNRIEWDNIKYFGTVDMQNNFNRKTFDGLLSLKGNRWTANQPAYNIIGNRAYIENLPTSGTRFLCLVGVLDNPTTACDWETDESLYPVSNIIKLEMVVKQDILSAYGIPKDKINDAQEVEVQQKQQQIPTNKNQG